jgi:hypothetical protein
MDSHQLPLSLWERGKGEGPPGARMTIPGMEEVEQRRERLPRVTAVLMNVYLNSKVFHGELQHE